MTIRVSWGDDTGRVKFLLPGMGTGTASAGDEQVFWTSGRRKLRIPPPLTHILQSPHYISYQGSNIWIVVKYNSADIKI
jgi:hypothetical protein